MKKNLAKGLGVVLAMSLMVTPIKALGEELVIPGTVTESEAAADVPKEEQAENSAVQGESEGISFDDSYEEYEKQWAEEKRKELERIGAPYTEGVNVQYNNEFLTFSEPPVVIGDYETDMVPLRDITEALGGQISYDRDTQEATVTFGDIKAVFKVNTKEVQIEYSQYSYDNELFEAPFISEKGNLMVPIEEFLYIFDFDMDYNLYYDLDIFAIVNKEALILDLNQDFSIVNKLVKGNWKALTGKRLRGSLSGEVSIYGDKENKTGTFQLSAAFDQNEKGFALSGKFQMDIQSLVKLFGGYYADELRELSNHYKAVDVKVLYDAEKDITYVFCPALNTDLGLDKDVWVSVSDGLEWIEDTLSWCVPGGDFFVRTNQTLGNQIYDDQYGDAEDSQRAAKQLRLIIGDGNFKTTNGANGVTYKCSVDLAELSKKLNANTSYYSGYYGYSGGIANIIEFASQLAKGTFMLEFQENAGNINELKISLKGTTDSPEADVDFSFAMGKDNIKFSANAIGEIGGKIHIEGSLLPKNSKTQIPSFTPPENAKVIDSYDI